jgi:CHAT domain-containing protein/tetratricopeptide (TPR) repeat protein
MQLRVERARILPASVGLLLWMLASVSAGWAQQTPPPKQDGGTEELQNLMKDLFKDLGNSPTGETTDSADKKDGSAEQTLQKLFGGGNPFGGLLGSLPAGNNQAGEEACQNYLMITSMQDMFKTNGTPEDRNKYKTLLDLFVASAQTGIKQNWQAHIRIAREALVLEKTIEQWPSSVPRGIIVGSLWANLTAAYNNNQLGDRAENIEAAVDAGLKALEYMPREGACFDQRILASFNLAAAYAKRIRGERAENLELALAALEAALQTIPPDIFPQLWATAQANLGGLYADRIRGRPRENQERSIQASNAALKIWDRRWPVQLWMMTQSNLGVAYSQRVLGDRAENIGLAIAAFEASLSVHKPEANGAARENSPAIDANMAPNEPESVSSIKNILEIMEVIEGEEAGGLTVFDFARVAHTYHNLANTYLKRPRGNRAENIERTIAAHEESLKYWKRDTHAQEWARAQNSLGEAVMLRLKGHRAANIEEAIGHFRLALSVRSTQSFPRGHFVTAMRLGQALSAKGDWIGALESFEAARASFRLLFGQGFNEAEARDLLQDAGPLFTDAAYAAATKGEVGRAFELLEEGKARLLAIALKLDRLPASPADRKKLDELRRQIREGEAAYEAAPGEEKAARITHLVQLRADLLKFVDAIEKQNGLEQAKDLTAAAAQILPKNGALVAPIISDAGGKAILITHAQGRVMIEAIDLPGLDRARLNGLLGARDQGGWLGAYSQQQQQPSEWLKAIDATGDELGRLFSTPLLEALAARGIKSGADGQLTILPVGPLGLLPLGLARHPVTGRYLMEDYTVNFAPSLAALVAAKTRAGKSGGEPTLTVVVNPTEDLSSTEVEGALVASRFAANGRRSLTRKDATSDMVLASLKGRDYWHFSSHGFFEWEEPRASGLLLAGRQPLTVGVLMDAREIGAPRLAVLSACETGLYDIATTPNEFTGLPAAFMRLGAGGVLATLWPVDDLSTALLIARFYDLHRSEKLPPAVALRAAQGWLRGAADGEIKDYLRRAIEEGRLPRDFLRSTDAALRAAMARQTSPKPFAHPYYWSGFTLTGL